MAIAVWDMAVWLTLAVALAVWCCLLRVVVQEVTLPEVSDLNRGRSYLADVAWRHGCPVYLSVEAAVEEVLARFGKSNNPATPQKA